MILTRPIVQEILDAIIKVRDSISDEEALKVTAIYPRWREKVDYKRGKRVIDELDGFLYKCDIPHTSEAGWEPSKEKALWVKVLIPDDEKIYEWEQPESNNGYIYGDKVLHNGYVWENELQGQPNIWEPGVYGWKQLQLAE